MKYFILYIQPLKMELIEGPETSTNYNRTPGKYPKEYIQTFLFTTESRVYLVPTPCTRSSSPEVNAAWT